MLNRIKVKNFKSLKKLNYSCAKLNLLSGLNGAGKSSFVQLLQLLKVISTRLEGAVSFTPLLKSEDTKCIGKFSDLKYCYAKDENIQIEVDIGGCDETLVFSMEVADNGAVKVKNNCFPAPFVTIAREKKIREAFENFKIVSAFRKKPCDVHVARYIDGQFDLTGDEVIEYLHVHGRKICLDVDNPMRHQSANSSERSFLIDEVNAWLGEVSPGAKLDIEKHDVGDNQMFVTSVSYGEGELHRTFRPQNVGFGVSYILPVLVSVLTAQPNDIIVIENPEAHLHPRGQGKMGELLANAAAWGVQLFVETHSDHVINGVRVAIKDGALGCKDAKIAFFERSKHMVLGGKGEYAAEVYAMLREILIDKNGSLSEYPVDFLDEWNNQLMELM